MASKKAKKKGRIFVWVAVPRGERHRIDAGYWLARTREQCVRVYMRDSAMPEQWEPRRVEIRPLTKGPTR